MIDEQLIYLNWSVDSSDAAPTEGQQQLFAKLRAELQEQLDVWHQILSQDLTRFNREAEKQKISLVDVRTQQ
jgi:hypothetical protein